MTNVILGRAADYFPIHICIFKDLIAWRYDRISTKLGDYSSRETINFVLFTENASKNITKNYLLPNTYLVSR